MHGDDGFDVAAAGGLPETLAPIIRAVHCGIDAHEKDPSL